MPEKISWKKLRVILVPVADRGHLSLYAINIDLNQVHVMDTLPYYEDSFIKLSDRHGEPGALIVSRLNTLMQKKSKGVLRRFDNARLSPFPCPLMARPNDCTFMSMKFVEHYTGEEGCLDNVVNPQKSAELRADYLHYLLFHPKNQAVIAPEIMKFCIPGVPH